MSNTLIDVIDSFDGDYRWLSNFIPNSLGYSVEHAYQAAKAKYPQDSQLILSAPTPGKAKRYGKRIEVRDDWNEVKLLVMDSCVRIKFLDDDEFCKKLADTNDIPLIEGNNWSDTYWGVCDGKGENNLGKILMSVREDCKKKIKYEKSIGTWKLD